MQDLFVIYGLTIQKVGIRLDFRCRECTSFSGRTGLVKQDGPPIKLYCRIHPENSGQWDTPEKMEEEKLALAKRIGLN